MDTLFSSPEAVIEISVSFTSRVVPNNAKLNFLKVSFSQRVLRDYQTELFQ